MKEGGVLCHLSMPAAIGNRQILRWVEGHQLDPNPNTGKPFRSSTETRVATNTVYLSAGHPSRIELPICK
jgi:hypothetical protein